MLDVCLRQGKQAGVIFADVDNFKRLNDTWGHPFGDFVLQRIAAILRKATRDCDLLARYGGEEFVLVVVNCSADVVRSVAERIRKTVETEIFEHNGQRALVTISVGGSTYVPDEVAGIGTATVAGRILKDADTAMYQCKKNGRNQSLVQLCRFEETVGRGLLA
jgi:diguanylate cyclase (GGDEF)-like protein